MRGKNMKEIPPAKPYFPQEDILLIEKDVEKILQSGMLTLGDYTNRFETEFARFCKVRRAVAVNSGTCALEIALRAMSLKKGDQVLVSTNTFSATAAAVIFAGGKPVFTDIDAESLCINSENVQKHLTDKTKGTGCFSFYPTKIMTAGEGGVITTDREELAEAAAVLRDQGKENFSSNIIIEVGYNWRMPEINAAIGLRQLRRLPEFIKRRNEIASYYNGELSKIESLKPLRIPKNALSNYYKYMAFLSPEISRDDLKQRLREKGVKLSGEVYWPPLHMQPVYKRLLKVKEGDFPVAEDACRRMICLPIYSQMTIDEARYVTEKVKDVLSSL